MQNGGLDNTFQHLPSANYLLRMQSVAEELQRISVAHQQVLCVVFSTIYQVELPD